MQCEKFETRLHQLLDRRLPPESDGELHAHAILCAPCRELLDAQSVLFEALDFYEPPATSPAFAERVVEQVALPRQDTKSRSPMFWMMGVAAAVVLFASIAPQLLQPPGENPFPRAVKADRSPGVLSLTSPRNMPNDQRRKPAAVEEAVESREPTSRDIDSRSIADVASHDENRPLPAIDPAELANGYRQWVEHIERQQYAIMQSQYQRDEYRDLLDNWRTRLTDMPNEPVERIPDGLRPIASSLTVAIDLLRRTLPRGKQPPAAKPQANFSPRTTAPA